MDTYTVPRSLACGLETPPCHRLQHLSLSPQEVRENCCNTISLFAARWKKKTVTSELFFLWFRWFFLKGFGVVSPKFWSFFYPPSSPINLQQGGRNFTREGSGGWGWRGLAME